MLDLEKGFFKKAKSGPVLIEPLWVIIVTQFLLNLSYTRQI